MIEHGYIKAELVEHMGSDLSVVNAARVSFDKTHHIFEQSDEKLINYLAKHNHWSPFAHPQLSFRYTVPFFVARQEFKHIVGFVRNEVSRRYVDDTPVFYLPDEWRGKPINAKQGSSEEVIDEVDFDPKGDYERYGYELGRTLPVDDFVEEGYRDSLFRYETLIFNGVAPELARMVIPNGAFTSYIITGSLAAYARFVNLRKDPHAQKEIRDLAEITEAQVAPLFPHSWKALTNV